jgi:hypothetical protein
MNLDRDDGATLRTSSAATGRTTRLAALAASASLLLALTCASCSKSDREAGKGTGGASSAQRADLSSFLLASEPAGAKSVKDVVASAKSGDEVVVVGRVGEEGHDTAYFALVDSSLHACTEMPMPDPCPTPWDFCCTDAKERAKLSTTVEFRRGPAGVAHGSILGVAGLDHLKTVVVTGKAEKDAHGNLTVAASGVFVRP